MKDIILYDKYYSKVYEQQTIIKIIDKDVIKVFCNTDPPLKNWKHIPINHGIWYSNIGEEFESPFMCWENLFLCSNNYGIAPNDEYMNQAVQSGKKLAAELWVDYNSEKGKEIIKNLPSTCSWKPFSKTRLFVYHPGKLSDYYSFDVIKSFYEKHGVFTLNWGKIHNYFDYNIHDFTEEKKTFDLLNNSHPDEMVIIGLLFGYPLESTIAAIKNQYLRLFDNE